MNCTEVNNLVEPALFYTNPVDPGQEELRVGLICDESVSVPIVSGLTFHGSLAECTITAASVCAVITKPAVYSFISKYSYYWGAPMLVAGGFLTFFGRKLFPVSMFIAGLFATVYATVLFVYTIWLNDNYEDWVGWTVVAVSSVVGAGIGLLFAKFIRAGACLLGGFGGYILGLLLNILFLYYSKTYVLFWIVVAVLAILGGAIGFLRFNETIIVSTAFLGSYIFCRGISMYAGGWTNEYSLINEIEWGAIDHVSKWVYVYFAGMVVMTVAGILV